MVKKILKAITPPIFINRLPLNGHLILSMHLLMAAWDILMENIFGNQKTAQANPLSSEAFFIPFGKSNQIICGSTSGIDKTSACQKFYQVYCAIINCTKHVLQHF